MSEQFTTLHAPERTPAATSIRRQVGVYENYVEAQQVVDRLSDAGFPVDKVAIVGCDLRLVEQVTGRLTTGRAAGLGAAGGAWWGLFVGLLLGVFTVSFVAPVLVGLVLGALFGAGTGALAHAALRGRRDFTSVQTLAADRYEVLVEEEAADEALSLLGR
jgi:hypothetical protein